MDGHMPRTLLGHLAGFREHTARKSGLSMASLSLAGATTDRPLVRGLRKIKPWLTKVDKRRLSSLPQTFAYFTSSSPLHRATSDQHSSVRPHCSPQTVRAFVSPERCDLPELLAALALSTCLGDLC